MTEAGTDLNDYVSNGRYFFDSSVIPTNIPKGNNGWLSVYKGTNSFVKQIWYRAGTANSNDFETYVRTKDFGGTWSNWKKYAMEETIIETGEETDITVPASGYVTIEVAFTKTFNNAPRVVATPYGNYHISCQLNNVSKTGFVINVRSVDGTERTSRKVTWIAVGN